VGRGQRTRRQHPACQCILRELAHPHRVFDRGSGAVHDGIVDAARDRDDIDIDRRREAAIEPQLLFAAEATPGEGGEIEKAEIERLLDLVREFAGQEYVRDVCFQMRDSRATLAEPRRIGKRGNDRVWSQEIRRRSGIRLSCIDSGATARACGCGGSSP
jgi:hypothetical protein